jgi:hypothetical protein
MIRNKRNWRHITDAIDVRPWTKQSRLHPVGQ